MNHSPLPLEDLGARLSQAAQSVTEAAQASEDRFMAYLGRVQALLEACLDLASQAEAASARLDGEGLEVLGSELRQGLQALGQWDTGAHAATGLDRLVSPLGDVLAAAEGAKHSVRYLRALAVSTRIEVARFGADRSDLLVLPEVVARLSVRIGELFDTVHGRSLRLEEALRERRERLRGLEVQGVENLRRAATHLSEALTAVTKACSQARSAAQGVERAARRAGNAASRILTSLQSQDITRQRLEQVGLALEAAAEYARRHDAGEESTAAELVAVLSLEIAQLDEALSSYAGALKALGREFEEISGAAAGLRSSLEGVGVASCESAVAGDEGLGAHIQSLQDTKREVDQMLRQAAEEADALTEHVDTIDEIVSDLDLIALNAIIQAAGVGSEGRTLAVIASEIQREASEAGEVGRCLAGALRRVGEESAALGRCGEAGEGGDTLEMLASLPQRFSEEIRAFKETRQEVEAELGARLGRLEEVLHEAHQESPAVRVRDEVASIRREMALLLEAARTLASEGKPGPGDLLSRVQNDYTMEKQRLVHDEVVGDGVETSRDGFGGNVELF